MLLIIVFIKLGFGMGSTFMTTLSSCQACAAREDVACVTSIRECEPNLSHPWSPPHLIKADPFTQTSMGSARPWVSPFRAASSTIP